MQWYGGSSGGRKESKEGGLDVVEEFVQAEGRGGHGV